MCDCSTISWWLAGWRALHFLACLLPVGLLAFHLLVAAPVLGSGSGPSRATLACILAALLIALASGIAWLLMLAGNIGGVGPTEALRSGVVTAVLQETQFGAVWRIRAVFWVVACASAVLMLLRHRLSKNIAWPCLFATAALLGALAWAGHGVEGEGHAAQFHVVADMVHLLAGGIWPFGLGPFAIAILTLQKGTDPSRWVLASALTRRFSALALCCVGLLTLTGMANSWFMLPSISALVQSGYGRVLSLKIAVFVAMIVFAAVNRFLLKPRLAAGQDAITTAVQLRRNVMVEFALGTGIILIVGLLGLLPPPTP